MPQGYQPTYRFRARLHTIYDEFFEFFANGSVLDLTAAVIIGNAFEELIKSLVSDVALPPIGLLVRKNFENWFFVIRHGATGSEYLSLAEAHLDGAVTVNIGNFLQAVLTFFLIIWLLFIAISGLSKMREEAENDTEVEKKHRCKWCTMYISRRALRCPYCTSDLRSPGAPAPESPSPSRPISPHRTQHNLDAPINNAEQPV